MGAATAAPIPFGDRFDYSLSVTLPPLGIVIFKAEEQKESGKRECADK